MTSPNGLSPSQGTGHCAQDPAMTEKGGTGR